MSKPARSRKAFSFGAGLQPPTSGREDNSGEGRTRYWLAKGLKQREPGEASRFAPKGWR